MRMVSGLLAADSLFVTLHASADVAPVDTTFYFTGDCTDCSDPSAVVVLQNYTFGTPLQDSNLVSFTYSSSVISPSTFTQDDFGGYGNEGLSGSLGAATGSYDFSADFEDVYGIFNQENIHFSASTDGTWFIGGDGPPTFDQGTNGVFSLAQGSATPEPSSVALLGTGLVGVAGAARRRLVR